MHIPLRGLKVSEISQDRFFFSSPESGSGIEMKALWLSGAETF